MKRTTNCCLTLPPDLIEQLDRRAAEQVRSRSNLVHVALQEWLLTTAAPTHPKVRQSEARP